MIRKISIGSDYKDAMHYTVGQYMRGSTIASIKKINASHYEIWVSTQNEDTQSPETYLWKEVVNMPVVVERDIESFSNMVKLG